MGEPLALLRRRVTVPGNFLGSSPPMATWPAPGDSTANFLATGFGLSLAKRGRGGTAASVRPAVPRVRQLADCCVPSHAQVQDSHEHPFALAAFPVLMVATPNFCQHSAVFKSVSSCHPDDPAEMLGPLSFLFRCKAPAPRPVPLASLSSTCEPCGSGDVALAARLLLGLDLPMQTGRPEAEPGGEVVGVGTRGSRLLLLPGPLPKAPSGRRSQKDELSGSKERLATATRAVRAEKAGLRVQTAKLLPAEPRRLSGPQASPCQCVACLTHSENTLGPTRSIPDPANAGQESGRQAVRGFTRVFWSYVEKAPCPTKGSPAWGVRAEGDAASSLRHWLAPTPGPGVRVPGTSQGLPLPFTERVLGSSLNPSLSDPPGAVAPYDHEQQPCWKAQGGCEPALTGSPDEDHGLGEKHDEEARAKSGVTPNAGIENTKRCQPSPLQGPGGLAGLCSHLPPTKAPLLGASESLACPGFHCGDVWFTGHGTTLYLQRLSRAALREGLQRTAGGWQVGVSVQDADEHTLRTCVSLVNKTNVLERQKRTRGLFASDWSGLVRSDAVTAAPGMKPAWQEGFAMTGSGDRASASGLGPLALGGEVTECTDCHVPPVSGGEVTEYTDCHVPPVSGGEVTECTDCHVPPVSGGEVTECTDCHVPPVSGGEVTECTDCHVPPVSGGEVTECTDCHVPPVSGGEVTECTDCHVPPVSGGEVTECTDCHVPPVSGGEVTECTDCHVPPVSGGEVTECTDCHVPPVSGGEVTECTDCPCAPCVGR
ncbi:hypothetical protein TREES_T100008361 [Tupaia chinensis]|uniref:Uncharacterized protein n=1 Tax=Tupaia chinensis TaxID=246437 RepID=L9LBC5_TUPCH|nr:hypothetical protein TREES_T100008361 [Tupaia chinensis]